MSNTKLREIPSVSELLKSPELVEASERLSPAFVASAVREVLAGIRSDIVSGAGGGGGDADLSTEAIVDKALALIETSLTSSLKRVINATGTVLHTNLGRAYLSEAALRAVVLAGRGAVNIEYDLKKGSRGGRGERDSHVEGLIKELTGAEAVCVVNNNAAAVLIVLNTLADGREVVISRGELVEIGGSFRLPDIIEKSGAKLKEVGTTNRTHPADYSGAAGAETALILKAHTSNYRVVGFTTGVALAPLSGIAKKAGVALVEDLGSGALVDLTELGLGERLREPLVKESIEAGADIVTFSGDKLLGGPQAGIIAGKKEYIDLIKKNPLKRALRVDKLTTAALAATLREYLAYAGSENLAKKLPTLKYLTRSIEDIEEVATEARGLIAGALGEGFEVEVAGGESEAGSGSLPEEVIPTKVITVSHADKKPEEISRLFLDSKTPILGRIKNDLFTLDMRLVEDARDVVPVI
ncbi:MAG: L-seryl-tRNA(Sec) selenium transferase [Thermodesulfobacteriota bacterium]